EPSVCIVKEMPEDRELWHLDVVKASEGYDALIVLINKGKGLRNAELYFANSGDGINWRLSESPVLIPSANDWDNMLVYRSTAVLLEERGERGTYLRKYAIWYSACNENKEWHIGYTELSICIYSDKLMLCEGF
ncbi:MAG: hypothetical protein NZ992_08065, partial [Candidatus Korarchaeum sp.]|nr:hypothetical protein [Candidatus Korarchaeum sp.]MDW8035954.1 hypothetical protein [Candidatus Korarchaeum sp.]